MSAEETEGVRAFPRRLQFTPEEVAVLRRCRFESTVYRGLPVGIMSAYVIRTLSQSGVLGNIGRKFPAVLWSGALGVGFFVGVASYQQNCFDQIMKLENSKLAEQVRAYQRMKRDDVPADSLTLQEHGHVSPQTDPHSLHVQDEFLTPPVDKSQDYYRESGVLSDKEADDAKCPTSFDEIRAQRRQQQREQYKSIASQGMQSPSRLDSNIQHEKPLNDPRLKSENKYGDVGWE